MGELKNQDTTISSTEAVKKKRGNPNLKKGVRNPYYNGATEQNTNTQETKTTMAEEGVTPNIDTSDKKVIPDDIFSDVIPTEEIIPLEGEPRNKDYATLSNSNTSQTGDQKQTINNNTPPPGNNNTTANPQQPVDPNTPPVMPGTPTGGPPVTPAEVQTKAEQAVNMFLIGYDKLHGIGRQVGKIKDEELTKLHLSGRINVDRTLPLGKKSTNLREFAEQVNTEIDENIVVTKEFKEQVKPPLTRLAIKYNIGLSDEWFVAGLFAEDILTKGAVLWALNSTGKEIIEACMKIEKELKESREPVKKEEIKKVDNTEEININPNDMWKDAESATVVG